MRSTRAFLIGAGAAYLFDPRQGKRRRNVLKDRSAAIVRRSTRLGVRKARFAGGHARGFAAIARRIVAPRHPRIDDDTVVQRIRSDVLRSVGVSTRNVEVRVEDGVAVLRGAVGSRSAADELVSRTTKVPGVRDVAAMIRVSRGERAA